ncbi:tetratricopeptide repeat protein [Ramlibacter sp. USB13]|uniref:Tetratricopeptide repeat protein n=1 Tax=Ramlibacter cellulosilyticus TaxID=2764187 RepID=A0A923SAU6_9BURK|nr:tetratricopeptide repeat protein [Ramlibacter cellulosilyticus]MBC5783129.1 tetratricopeptide repeat protein [Ramlibacter cellulosilyticus]
MKQQQRKALALAAVLALSAFSAAAQGTGAAARGAQAANSAADTGYKAYARRDYAAAVEAAQRAVQLAPQRRDYWLLLAQALAANGQLSQADQALERAAQARGDDAALTRARADLGRMHAQAAGDAMYKALAAGDVKTAVAQGTEAVRWAPENAGYRLVLVHALLRDMRYADADRVATEALALLPESAAPLALRAYARQGLNRPAEAAADVDRALQQRGVSAAAHRQLRLLAADLALAQGNGQRAMDLLAAFPANDGDAAARRELARQRLAGMAGDFALRAPGIDCSNVDAAQTCTLQAAALPPMPGFANATAAYRALEQKDVQRALEQARIATNASPGNRDWQLMHMNAALAANENAEAERAATAALALRADAATLAQRSTIRRSLGDVAGANADAEAALQSGELPVTTQAALLADLGRTREARERLASAPAEQATPQTRLDQAYLSTRIGDSEGARQAFAAADAAGGLPPTSLLDAGYAAMKSKHDQEAIGYFHRAIDAVNGMQLKLDPQLVYDTRRSVADLERRWGVLASLTMRNAGGVVPGIGVVGGPTGSRTTQAGAEVYYRPWGWRNGEFVEFFARGFMTLDSQANGDTGSDSFSGALGARWKPFSSQNLVLSLARVFGPNVNGDWLAQVGYSYDYGNDLRVDVPSWWTHRFYGEVGRYLEEGNNYGLAYLYLGRQYLVGNSGRTTVYPHLFAGLEYNSADLVEKTSSGVGPGISLRHWFREDVYTAPRSYWDITAQYRFRTSGDDRLKGFYLNAFLNY